MSVERVPVVFMFIPMETGSLELDAWSVSTKTKNPKRWQKMQKMKAKKYCTDYYAKHRKFILGKMKQARINKKGKKTFNCEICGREVEYVGDNVNLRQKVCKRKSCVRERNRRLSLKWYYEHRNDPKYIEYRRKWFENKRKGLC